jgi:hypothetical protein
MSSTFKSLQGRFAYKWFGYALLVGYFAALSPLWIVPLLISRFVKNPNGWSYAASLLGLVSCVAAFWFSRISAHYMAIENQTFRVAFLRTFLPVLTNLSFMPVVGGYLEGLIAKHSSDPRVSE